MRDLSKKKCLLLLWGVCVSMPMATAKTIVVGTNQPVRTIMQGLRRARPHDVIVVRPGVYREQIRITRPVVLRGEGQPVIDGGLRGTTITVTADTVCIEGFRIVNSGRSSLRDYCAVLCQDSRQVVIRRNVLRGNQFGVMLQNCERGLITDNDVESDITDMPVMGNAIHCWKSDMLHILRNRIGHNRDGIYLEFVYNSVIARNKVSSCERYGLHFMFSHQNVYHHNHFSHNQAGVAVMYTHDVQMHDNVFEQNRGGSSYGLLLKEISRGTIAGNQFRDNTVGIMMDGGTNLRLHHNLFHRNGWAMRVVASSTNDTITRNNFVGNTFDLSTNSSYNSNVFDGNYWDKYNGYDLNRDGIGDVPFHPLSLFSMLAERNRGVLLFFRSFLMTLLDESERLFPSITPDNYVDQFPLVSPVDDDFG